MLGVSDWATVITSLFSFTKGAGSMPDSKPNILVIWGDDIGITNLSCYSDGLMGYRTPNIDRIAEEGNAVHRFLW
jgi:arylsulfatase A-like enzyme